MVFDQTFRFAYVRPTYSDWPREFREFDSNGNYFAMPVAITRRTWL